MFFITKEDRAALKLHSVVFFGFEPFCLSHSGGHDRQQVQSRRQPPLHQLHRADGDHGGCTERAGIGYEVYGGRGGPDLEEVRRRGVLANPLLRIFWNIFLPLVYLRKEARKCFLRK